MKKICHVLSGFFRNDTRIFQKQCRSLAAFGYEVYILTNDGIPNEEKEGIKIISCDSGNKSRIQAILSGKSTFLKKALEIDADIYQLHGPELIPLGLALKDHNKIVFYDAHEDLPQQILEKEWIPGFMRKPLSQLIKWYLKKNLRKFDEIFTVSPHIVESLRTMSDSVTLVTNYPIIENIAYFDQNAYCERENIICYSGTVYHTSNQEYLLDALNNIDGAEYHIAGTIDDNFLKKLSSFRAWKKSKFLGRLSKNELKFFLNNAIAGFIVYDYTPNVGYKKGTLGSNKLFEYMEAGLPLICTDFDLWKEIIDKYKCGLYVQPHNSKQIEDAIIYIINNKAEAFQMGQNGKKAIIEEYNWKTQEKIYLDVFIRYND